MYFKINKSKNKYLFKLLHDVTYNLSRIKYTTIYVIGLDIKMVFNIKIHLGMTTVLLLIICYELC